MDVLDEVEGKAIIWANYQYDVQTICKRIEKRYGPGSVVHYYGKTLPEERDKALKNFKTKPNVGFCRHSTYRWVWFNFNFSKYSYLLF